jgi:ABC-type branched-subunit amino acid transport system substrate-binding protein
MIVALSTTQTVCAVRTLAALDPDLRVLAADAFEPSELSSSALSVAERRALHYVVTWEPGTDSLSREFVRRARALTGRDPTPGQAMTHDAFMLVEQAVREGHTSRAAIRRWLHALGTPGHPPFQGVTGPITFLEPRRTLLRVRRLTVEPK